MNDGKVYEATRLTRPLDFSADTGSPGAASPRAAFWDTLPSLDLVDVATGAKPRQSTRVKLAWFEQFLYIFFDVSDTYIWGTYRHHDDPLYEEEVVEIFLDPYSHGRVYYELEVSPHGVLFDAVVLNRRTDPGGPRDMDTLTGWNPPGFRAAIYVDGELDSRTAVSRGWQAEIQIDLRDLGAPRIPHPDTAAGAEICWGMNLFRIDRHPDGDEYQAWSPTGRIDFHLPQFFGQLRFGTNQS